MGRGECDVGLRRLHAEVCEMDRNARAEQRATGVAHEVRTAEQPGRQHERSGEHEAVGEQHGVTSREGEPGARPQAGRDEERLAPGVVDERGQTRPHDGRDAQGQARGRVEERQVRVTRRPEGPRPLGSLHAQNDHGHDQEDIEQDVGGDDGMAFH